jgi:hypothetical protein
MSAPGGQHVAGDDLDNVIKQAIAEELAKASKPGDGNSAPDQTKPVEVNIGGQVYRFQDQAELSRALEQTFAGYQNQLAQLQAGSAAAPGQHVSGDEDTGPKFSNQEYIALLEKDALKAQEYLDSFRYFGGKVPEPSKVIRDQLIRSAELEKVVTAYQFKDAHPEFRASPQAAHAIDRVREALGLPFSFEGLEAAYATAVQKGILPDPRIEQLRQQMQGQENPGYPRRGPAPGASYGPPAPPPLPSGGGGFNPGSLPADPEDMTLEQIHSVLSRLDRK